MAGEDGGQQPLLLEGPDGRVDAALASTAAGPGLPVRAGTSLAKFEGIEAAKPDFDTFRVGDVRRAAGH